MSYCEYESSCPRRTNYRNSGKTNNEFKSGVIYEPPVRDGQNDDGPPPKPPNGDWELQYCKWSGWTWVKKTDKGYHDRPHPEHPPHSTRSAELSQEEQKRAEQKKKSGGFFDCCFKKKKPPEPAHRESVPKMAPPPPPPSSPPPPQQSEREKGKRGSDECECCCCCRMDFEPCCCCCCSCNQVCCCCCVDDCPEPPKAPCCCNRETQTEKHMKEQATKMSEMHIPKEKTCRCQCRRKRRCRCKCRCRRPVCCPCIKTTCCPCMTNTCCPCTQTVCCPCKTDSNNTNNSNKKTEDGEKINNDKLINYCLKNSLQKPSGSTFLNLKPSNFSILHKSLDILLKNNINIMTLFDTKKELKTNFGSSSFQSSTPTISNLNPENIVRKADTEHCKLLTAVCDAILSSHKFDEKLTTFEKEPLNLNSSSFFSNRGFLEKILNNLDFPTKNDNGVNPHKEIGVQVGQKSPRVETTFQAKKSLTKLVKNKSKILLAPRFPKRIEALKKNADSKCQRRIIYDSKKERMTFFKNDDSKCACGSKTTTKEGRFKLEDIETLLRSVQYISGKEEEEDKDKLETFLEGGQTDGLFNGTSPQFTDSELLLNEGKGNKDYLGGSSG